MKIECVQTDNGFEFTNRFSSSKRDIPTLFEATAAELGIRHKLIRPYTPRHNGKVERSHREDQKRFYAVRCFFSLAPCVLLPGCLPGNGSLPSLSMMFDKPTFLQIARIKREFPDNDFTGGLYSTSLCHSSSPILPPLVSLPHAVTRPHLHFRKRISFPMLTA